MAPRQKQTYFGLSMAINRAGQHIGPKTKPAGLAGHAPTYTMTGNGFNQLTFSPFKP